MKLPALTRKTHYWVSIVFAVPLLVVVCSGILLQLKKDWTWVQPAEAKGSGKIPTVTMEQILSAARSKPEAGVKEWDDVARIDIRPNKKLVKVTTKTDWEVQIDAGTGDVLLTAYRRSDWIEAIHDGSWFHSRAKYYVFLPTAVALLFLWVSGVYLFFYPRWVRWNRTRQKATTETQRPQSFTENRPD